MLNGEKELPTIKVVWDAERQVAGAEFQPAEFKTWDMVVGVLEMALNDAKFKLNMARMQGMQMAQMQAAQQMQQAAANAELLNKLKR